MTPPKNGWNRPCEVCGTEFYVRPCEIRKAEQRGCQPPRVCSRTCRDVNYRGSGNPKWRGGFYLINGYRFVKAPDGHPFARKSDGYIQEHRLVMERYIGRYLEPHECVHHFNHNRQDNRIENLELLTWSTHQRRHGYYEPFECAECGQIVMRSRGRRRLFTRFYCSRKCAAAGASRANANKAQIRRAS